MTDCCKFCKLIKSRSMLVQPRLYKHIQLVAICNHLRKRTAMPSSDIQTAFVPITKQLSARSVLARRVLIHGPLCHEQLQAVALQDECTQQQLHARHQAARLLAAPAGNRQRDETTPCHKIIGR